MLHNSINVGRKKYYWYSKYASKLLAGFYIVTEIRKKELLRKNYKAKLNSLANDSDAIARHTVKQFIFVKKKIVRNYRLTGRKHKFLLNA